MITIPHLPTLRPRAQTRLTTDSFLGLDRRERVPDGAWAETENLSLRCRPALAEREKRGLVAALRAPGGLAAKDALCWVENGTLYVGGLPTPLTGLPDRPRQLVSMGATLVLWPDRLYYNTAEPADFGSLDADWSYTGTVEAALCRADGSLYAAEPTVSDTEPEDPANLDLWLDSSGGGRRLCQYSAAAGLWTEIETPYVRLRFTTQGQLPALFAALDGVALSGAPGSLDGEQILRALGGAADTERDWIVVTGTVDGSMTLENRSVRLTRRAPDMDFICECGNRLWGCFYGSGGGQSLNEIYGCALGDFKNWRQFLGLATDSWAASVGSDGPWTGAVGYLGSPLFFKADRLHRLTISPTGAHRLSETPCRGVQKGSHKSLAVVGETLFYRSDAGVCAWQGGFPEPVGAALGADRADSAVGGALGACYYLSQRRADGTHELLVCDSESGLWLREDDLDVADFAASGGELYALTTDGRVLAMTGRAGAPESAVRWYAVTAPQHYLTPDRKYPGRLDLRFRLGPGAAVRALLSYDGETAFHEAGALTAPAQAGGGAVLRLPVRPRRCDSYRLRLEGTGEARLLAITQVLEKGSDL